MGVGYFSAFHNSAHKVGISYATLGDQSLPCIVVDQVRYDVLPNNKKINNNNKIVDTKVDYSTSPWRLRLDIYIDGQIYTKYIQLKDA